MVEILGKSSSIKDIANIWHNDSVFVWLLMVWNYLNTAKWQSKEMKTCQKVKYVRWFFGIEKFFSLTQLVVFYVNSYFFLYVLTESSRTTQSKRTRREKYERDLQELFMQSECANVCAPNRGDEWANVFTFFSCELFAIGLLDTITSTENAKDCPGVCVHALATLICYEVLEDIKCPTSSMKCCVESSSAGKIWPLACSVVFIETNLT